jgi:O-6-methylguanine DNA methyltransferase
MKKLDKKVFELVMKIPKGNVTTYGEIAKALGKPKAYRVVGQILRKNKDIDRIPCFKVIRSDGSLGGYVLGKKEKIKRLRRDGIEIKNRKVDLKKYIFRFCER